MDSVVVIEKANDGSYSAYVPDLPGCVACGGGAFPSGVFCTREKAEAWINKHRLTGVLTKYPLDEGAWDWAVREGHFKPTRENQKTPSFIQRFAWGEEHYHYGEEEDEGG